MKDSNNDSPAKMQTRIQVDARMEALRQQRLSWFLYWRDIAEYMLPRRYKWFITPNQFNRGSNINQKIIDSTVIKCVRDLAAGLMGGMVSPARLWFTPSIMDKELAEYYPVKVWLMECRKRVMAVMAASNFYTSTHTLLTDLGVFGSAPMIIYEDYENVIQCYTPCSGEYFLGNNYKYEVDTLYREFTNTVKQVIQQFGRENCSDNVTTLFDSNQTETEVIVCHAIEPNPDQKQFKYREVYWERAADKKFLLLERGFHEKPFVAPRWDVVGDDAYGRSPGMDALGDVKQLMIEQKRKAQAIDKMVNPPMVADAVMKNQPASMLPGGITYVASTSQSVGFKPAYEMNINLGDMKEDISQVQQRIKELFFNDLFLMISQLDTVRTATEIVERKQEKLLMLGPVVERFQTEFLDQAISRIFAIMFRAGLFPPAPPELKGQELEMSYTSMFTEAQKGVETTGVERLNAMAGSMAAVKPEVLDKINFDEMIDEYGDMLSVNPKMFYPQEVVDQTRQARAQQQQQQQLMEQSATAVQGAEVLSNTNVGGGQNALQMMTGL